MTNMFIKISLNSKTLITSSSKETAGTPTEVRVKLPCFFLFKLLGQLMWLEQNLGSKSAMCRPLRHSPGFLPENLGKESVSHHCHCRCDSLFLSSTPDSPSFTRIVGIEGGKTEKAWICLSDLWSSSAIYCCSSC